MNNHRFTDEQVAEALRIIVDPNRTGSPGASLLQRRMRIGYALAAELIDFFEEKKVISLMVEGYKPRLVLAHSLSEARRLVAS